MKFVDKKVLHTPPEFFKSIRAQILADEVFSTASITTHFKDARNLFGLMSYVLQGKEFDPHLLSKSVFLYQHDINCEALNSAPNGAIILPDKFLINQTDEQLVEHFFLDADFNDLILLFFDMLHYENEFEIQQKLGKTEKNPEDNGFNVFEYIGCIGGSTDQESDHERILKKFLSFVKSYHKRMFTNGCFDILSKPLVSRFENLYYQETFPSKRLRKSLLIPFTIQQKNNAIYNIAERISKDLASLMILKDIRIIYHDERFEDFFSLMKKFDRFGGLGIHFKDLELVSSKKIVREMTLRDFLSQPERFFETGPIIH